MKLRPSRFAGIAALLLIVAIANQVPAPLTAGVMPASHDCDPGEADDEWTQAVLSCPHHVVECTHIAPPIPADATTMHIEFDATCEIPAHSSNVNQDPTTVYQGSTTTVCPQPCPNAGGGGDSGGSSTGAGGGGATGGTGGGGASGGAGGAEGGGGSNSDDVTIGPATTLPAELRAPAEAQVFPLLNGNADPDSMPPLSAAFSIADELGGALASVVMEGSLRLFLLRFE